MRIKPLFLAVPALFLSVTQVTAQTDTNTIDLGYTSINKNFTQHSTIAAADLQRMPFSTIEEAINVYFNGIYTNKKTTTYIIDGNISSAIETLPINDIETITLIQNAQTLINDAYAPNQLIVIKTKAGTRSRSGISGSASLYYTKLRNGETGKLIDQSDPTLFHNYSITANKLTSKSEFGATINFLRSSIPINSEINILSADPHRINRIRGNAWFSTKFSNNHQLTIRTLVMPQDSTANRHYYDDFSQNNVKINNKQLFIYPSLQLASRLSNKFTNNFNASYSHQKSDMDAAIAVTLLNPAIPGNETSTSTIENIQTQKQLLLRNRTEYKTISNNWTFNPALNLFYLTEKNEYDYSSTHYMSGNNTTTNKSWAQQNEKDWAITPSVNLYYKSAFAFTAGGQYNSSRKPFFTKSEKKWYPFVSTSLDLLGLGKIPSSQSLKIFASYAHASSEIERQYRGSNQPFYFGGGLFEGVFPPALVNFNEPSTLILLGADCNIVKEGLKLSYTYSKNNFHQLFIVGGGFPATFTDEIKLSAHRFSINYNVIEEKEFSYRTSLTAYYTKTSSDLLNDNPYTWYFKTQMIPKGASGGFTNHFRIKRFTAGVNALYSFRDEVNSILLQHVYAGYKVKKMEVYLSGRNLLQNKKSIISTGYMVFYGAGVNVGL